MAYFMIGNQDFSKYVKSLKVNTNTTFNAQTNAAGNTVVDYINAKRTIEVGIIPLDSEAMIDLQTAISSFSVSISYRNPKTNLLEENVKCIIPSDDVSYYTIQTKKVMYQELTLVFTEL